MPRDALRSMEEAGLSLFCPLFNEQDSVEPLVTEALAALRPLGRPFELILVNDGSTDRTGELAEALATEHPEVRVVHHSENLGYGAALRSGCEAARFPLVAYTDGDRQFDLQQITLLLDRIAENDAVVGYRMDRQDPRLRLWAAKGYNLLIRALFGLKLHDIDCGFKLYRAEAVRALDIRSQGFFVDAEMLIKLRNRGCRIFEVGVHHRPRVAGQSTVRLSHILDTLREIVRQWRELRA